MISLLIHNNRVVNFLQSVFAQIGMCLRSLILLLSRDFHVSKTATFSTGLVLQKMRRKFAEIFRILRVNDVSVAIINVEYFKLSFGKSTENFSTVPLTVSLEPYSA